MMAFSSPFIGIIQDLIKIDRKEVANQNGAHQRCHHIPPMCCTIYVIIVVI